MPRRTGRNVTRRRRTSEAWSARAIATRLVDRHGRAGGKLLAMERRDRYVTHAQGRRVVLQPERWTLWHIVQDLCGWRRTRRGHA